MKGSPLRDVDTADQTMLVTLLVRAGVPLFCIVVGVELWLMPSLIIWLIVPDLVLSWFLVRLTHAIVNRVGDAAHGILMPSGTPPVHDYSEQEALVCAGHVAQAVDSYLAIIDAEPSVVAPRLRLAALYEELRDFAGAEACYLEVRRVDRDGGHDWRVTNALIDCYRRRSALPELKEELTRLVRRYRTTEAGRNAKAWLLELGAADRALSE